MSSYMGEMRLLVGILDGRYVRGELRNQHRSAPGHRAGQFGKFAQTFTENYISKQMGQFTKSNHTQPNGRAFQVVGGRAVIAAKVQISFLMFRPLSTAVLLA